MFKMWSLMKHNEKLLILLSKNPTDTLIGIFGTYCNHGIMTNFDHLYVDKEFRKLNL